jgi:phage tail protein X
MVTAQFIPYTTKNGDRWDTLAWRFYGIPTLIYPIIQSNPSVPIMAVFPAGIQLGIPTIEIIGPSSSANLPPWLKSVALPSPSQGATSSGASTGAGVPNAAGFGAPIQLLGTAPPTEGFFLKGTIVWNINPTPGGIIGWSCTATGSPGTWNAFGAISN